MGFYASGISPLARGSVSGGVGEVGLWLVAGLKCQSRRGATRQSQRDTDRGRGVNTVQDRTAGKDGGWRAGFEVSR